MDASGPYGAFGKLPGMGDFFRFNLPPGFLEIWDEWLQRGLLSAQASLGEDWQAAYFSAPIWRFTLAPGLAGKAAVTGILMCSVDRVGRQFPLTILRPADSSAEHLGMTEEFEALEEIALDAMEREIGRDELAEGLAEVSFDAPTIEIAVDGSSSVDISFDPETGTATGLAAGLIQKHYRAPSIWSALTPSGSRILMYEGLPDVDQMATFLTGKEEPPSIPEAG